MLAVASPVIDGLCEVLEGLGSSATPKHAG